MTEDSFRETDNTLSPLLDEGDAGGQPAIREVLRDAIVDRRLAPGTKLTEVEVGALFKVSRTLVRGALQALAHEGLVTMERNRGAFVANPSPEEARQIFEARRMIEPGMLAEAARRMTPADLTRLHQLLDLEGGLVDRRGHTARRAEIKASGDFHLALAAMTGNAVLQRFMDELVARSSLVIALYGQSTVSSCGHHEHHAIVDALSRGDVAEGSRLMIAHIAHIEADLDLRQRTAGDLREALRL
ncbi:GntR family transcriptional regulator [Rhizobium sp. YIM 134829]|uniref:GntR family transcriptional regulator n=1 Tax=Rhizobium sp. YIM 134829 TaxID=3390453 RepID=UPI00397D2495